MEIIYIYSLMWGALKSNESGIIIKLALKIIEFYIYYLSHLNITNCKIAEILSQHAWALMTFVLHSLQFECSNFDKNKLLNKHFSYVMSFGIQKYNICI
jgi:hypothetical protein